MRIIDCKAADAFKDNRHYTLSNTTVCKMDNIVMLILHGNIIAHKKIGSSSFFIQNCGYFTNVTKSRLNALPNVKIVQRGGVWYLNGVQWDGQETIINL